MILFSAFKAGIARLLYLQSEDDERPDDLADVNQLIDDEADPFLVCLCVVSNSMDDDVNGEHHIEEPAQRIRCDRNRQHDHKRPAEGVSNQGCYEVVAVLRFVPLFAPPRPAFHLRKDALKIEIVDDVEEEHRKELHDRSSACVSA